MEIELAVSRGYSKLCLEVYSRSGKRRNSPPFVSFPSAWSLATLLRSPSVAEYGGALPAAAYVGGLKGYLSVQPYSVVSACRVKPYSVVWAGLRPGVANRVGRSRGELFRPLNHVLALCGFYSQEIPPR